MRKESKISRAIRLQQLTLVVAGLLVAATSYGQAATQISFQDGTSTSGIAFVHHPGRSTDRLVPEVMGSGVVLADFDRNGAVDVVLVNGGLVSSNRPVGAENRIFLNDGRGRFTDASERWKLPSPGYGMGAAAGDIDNDGWIDLLLTTHGSPDVLLRNTGEAFEDISATAGLPQDNRWSTSAGFFDLEGDGDLDLWIVGYLDYPSANRLPCYFNRQPVYCTPLLENGIVDRLLRNEGDSTFTDISDRLVGSPGKGLALALGDIDLDGDTDVYVANDTTSNHLWINDGKGSLQERGLLSGVALSETGNELAGMGADISDINGDGLLDIGSTNFQNETTALYLQLGGLVFREASDSLGVGRSARVKLSFGMDFFDADNDGDEDLLVANGHLYDNLSSFSSSVTFEQENSLYQALAGGKFRNLSNTGDALAAKGVSRGLATGDFDGDGDLDFVVNNNGGPAQIGLNTTTLPAASYVSLWLEGRKANRSALGARIEAHIRDRVVQRQVHGSSSYLSMNDPRIHIGLGDAGKVDMLTIHWPGSKPQIINGLPGGKHYYLVEGQEPVPYVPGAFRPNGENP